MSETATQLELIPNEAPEVQAESSAPKIEAKAGDYIIDRAGNITRVAEVDAEAGILITVWGRQLLASELHQNGVSVYKPTVPAYHTNVLKCIDGSNTRTIIYEGIVYRQSDIVLDQYVELVGVPGLWPLDIFDALK